MRLLGSSIRTMVVPRAAGAVLRAGRSRPGCCSRGGAAGGGSGGSGPLRDARHLGRRPGPSLPASGLELFLRQGQGGGGSEVGRGSAPGGEVSAPAPPMCDQHRTWSASSSASSSSVASPRRCIAPLTPGPVSRRGVAWRDLRRADRLAAIGRRRAAACMPPPLRCRRQRGGWPPVEGTQTFARQPAPHSSLARAAAGTARGGPATLMRHASASNDRRPRSCGVSM